MICIINANPFDSLIRTLVPKIMLYVNPTVQREFFLVMRLWCSVSYFHTLLQFSCNCYPLIEQTTSHDCDVCRNHLSIRPYILNLLHSSSLTQCGLLPQSAIWICLILYDCYLARLPVCFEFRWWTSSFLYVLTISSCMQPLMESCTGR